MASPSPSLAPLPVSPIASSKRQRVLPDVPRFSAGGDESPLPPAPKSITGNDSPTRRTWAAASELPDGIDVTLNEDDYGSDDEEKELEALDEDALRTRCLSLMRAAKNANPVKSPRHTMISPAMYAVHGKSGVRKLKLGRTSSISTREELNKVPAERIEEHAVRLQNLFRQTKDHEAYASSAQFADDLLELCTRITPIFKSEPRVLELASPTYVFGDIHGNLDDLKFFSDNVWPLGIPLTAGGFLFLGDYVDRGQRGLEVLAYLFSSKIQVPDKVFLLRGNHETRSVNGWVEYYGDGSFLAQCTNRFGEAKGMRVWEECNKVFDHLPLAAIIDKTIFCVHGGIPRPPADPTTADTRLDDIRRIPCPIEVRQPSMASTDFSNRLAFALLWSDPADSAQEAYLEQETGFGNSVRGSGSVVFGIRAVEQFLKSFKLGFIMRAHEATANGVAVSKSAKVLTVFSTSKDHGCGGDAKCGCVLVDSRRILAITRSPEYITSTAAGLDSVAASMALGTDSGVMVSDFHNTA